MAGIEINSPFAAYVGWIEKQRQEQRAREDQDLDAKISYIHELTQNPRFNPQLLPEALKSLTELSGQKANPQSRKRAPGLSGFMGKSDPAAMMPEFLSSLMRGSRPVEGPTMQDAPDEPSGAPQAQGGAGWAPLPQVAPPPALPELSAGFQQPSRAEAPTGGRSVLQSPVPVPPAGTPFGQTPTDMGMLSAGQQLSTAQQTGQHNGMGIPPAPSTPRRQVPVSPDQQPLFKTGEDLAKEKGTEEGMVLTAKDKAEFDSMAALLGPDVARQAFAQKHGLKAPQPIKTIAGRHFYKGVDGQLHEMTLTMNPTTGEVTRIDLTTGQPVPDEAVEAAAGVPGTGAGSSAGARNLTPIQQALNDKFGFTDVTKATPAQLTEAGQLVFQRRMEEAAKKSQMSLGNALTVQRNAPLTYMTSTPEGDVPAAVRKGDLLSPKGGAAIPPPPKSSGKLNATEQEVVDTSLGLQPSIDKIKQVIQKYGLENANDLSALSGAKAGNFLREMGIAPNQVQEILQQRAGFVKAGLLRGLMGGRSSKYMAEILQKHMPSETQSPKLLYENLIQTEQEMHDRHRAVIQAHPDKKDIPQVPGEKSAADKDKEYEAFKNYIMGGAAK
jgi:hypothetical protein